MNQQLVNIGLQPPTEPLPGGVSIRRDAPKVGRNEPCPCGSGLKSKRCHEGVTR